MARAQDRARELFAGARPRHRSRQARAAALRAIELDPGMSDAHVALAEMRRIARMELALAEDDISNGDRAVAELRIGASLLRRSFSRQCRASAKRKPKPTARATGSALPRREDERGVGALCGGGVRRGDRPLPVHARHGSRLHAGAASARGGAARRRAARRGGCRADSGSGPDGDDPLSLAWLAHAQGAGGRRDEAGAIVAKLEASSQQRYVPAYHLALAHTGLGDRDAAFALLEGVVPNGPSLINLGVEPRFEPCAATPIRRAAAAARHSAITRTAAFRRVVSAILPRLNFTADLL